MYRAIAPIAGSCIPGRSITWDTRRESIELHCLRARSCSALDHRIHLIEPTADGRTPGGSLFSKAEESSMYPTTYHPPRRRVSGASRALAATPTLPDRVTRDNSVLLFVDCQV